MDTKIMRNPTSAKVGFCNSSTATCLVFQSQTSKFKLENIRKNKTNTFKVGFLIHPKSIKIQAWISKFPFLCSPKSQDRSNVPQDAKVEAPGKPNDNFGTKNLSYVRKYVKNLNLAAMSNGQAPAAEGVAHKM